MKLYERKIIAIKKSLELEKDILNIKKTTINFKDYHRALRQLNTAIKVLTSLNEIEIDRIYNYVARNCYNQLAIDVVMSYKSLEVNKNEK